MSGWDSFAAGPLLQLALHGMWLLSPTCRISWCALLLQLEELQCTAVVPGLASEQGRDAFNHFDSDQLTIQVECHSWN